MNELQKLAILCFIGSLLCILVGIINMIKNDYFDFVFFIVLSIIGFIISIYSYKKGKVEKMSEIYLIECKECKQPYATKQAPITSPLGDECMDGRLLTRCPNCCSSGGSVTKIPLVKR